MAVERIEEKSMKSSALEVYPNGQRAGLLEEDGSGIIYYPSGQVAIVIARVPTPNGTKYQRYFYDDDANNTLMCSMDERFVGFATATDPESEGLKFVSTLKGGLLSSNGFIQQEWKWDRRAQNAGTLPGEGISIQLNTCMSFEFKNRDHAQVTFICSGVKKCFDCARQLRRRDEDNYLRRSSRLVGGKLDLCHCEFKTLVQRQNELVAQLQHKRNMNKPSSKNITGNDDIKGVLATLESHFVPYGNKIAVGDFGQAYLHGSWKTNAFDLTLSEIPRINPTGCETGDLPNGYKLGCVLAKGSELEGHPKVKSPGVSLPKRWPTSVEVRRSLQHKYPALHRTKTLRAASGRYSTSAPVKLKLQQSLSCNELTSTTFDKELRKSENLNRLVIVLCVREDDGLCVKADQLFRALNSDFNMGGNQEECSPALYKFSMSESRFITKRYGVYTLPAYLAFYNTELIKARVLAARPIKLVSEKDFIKPRILLLERNYASQMRAERLLRKLKIQSELALSPKDARNHISFRAGIASANATTYYGIVFLDATISPSEAASLVDSAKQIAEQHPRGCTLAVSLLASGSVPYADLEEGVVKEPSAEQLLGAVTDVAITRPLKSTTLDRLLNLWRTLQRKKCGRRSRPRENITHFGQKKEDIQEELEKALVDAKSGARLGKGFKLGYKLTANEAKFRGVQLSK